MMASATRLEDGRAWVHAFLILMLISLGILTMRLLGNPFLALDFEITVVYVPSILAGIIALLVLKSNRASQMSP